MLDRLLQFISLRLFPAKPEELPPLEKCSWWIPSAAKVLSLFSRFPQTQLVCVPSSNTMLFLYNVWCFFQPGSKTSDVQSITCLLGQIYVLHRCLWPFPQKWPSHLWQDSLVPAAAAAAALASLNPLITHPFEVGKKLFHWNCLFTSLTEGALVLNVLLLTPSI